MTRKMLILDDDEAILRILKGFFSTLSFDVDGVQQEGEVKELLKKSTYLVAILDLGLARIDRTGGLDMIRYIRRRSPSTKIIVYTGNASPEIERLACKLGADSFVVKPASLPTLEKIVFRLCELDLAVKAYKHRGGT